MVDCVCVCVYTQKERNKKQKKIIIFKKRKEEKKGLRRDKLVILPPAVGDELCGYYMRTVYVYILHSTHVSISTE
jgi:hypothetical protein